MSWKLLDGHVEISTPKHHLYVSRAKDDAEWTLDVFRAAEENDDKAYLFSETFVSMDELHEIINLYEQGQDPFDEEHAP
jgi:hypothetical protein